MTASLTCSRLNKPEQVFHPPVSPTVHGNRPDGALKQSSLHDADRYSAFVPRMRNLRPRCRTTGRMLGANEARARFLVTKNREGEMRLFKAGDQVSDELGGGYVYERKAGGERVGE